MQSHENNSTMDTTVPMNHLAKVAIIRHYDSIFVNGAGEQIAISFAGSLIIGGEHIVAIGA